MNNFNEFIIDNFGIEKFTVLKKALDNPETGLNQESVLSICKIIVKINLTGKLTHLSFDINNDQSLSLESWFSITSWFGEQFLTISFVQNEPGVLYEHSESIDDIYVDKAEELLQYKDLYNWLKNNGITLEN